jgi:hypothetical protein
MPAVVDQLQAMMAQMERMSLQLNERLLGNQDGFHTEVKGVYRALAASVDQSLKDSLTQSARVAGESIKPILEAAMTGIAQDARGLHAQLRDTAHSQLNSLNERFEVHLAAVQADHANLLDQQAQGDLQRQAVWTESLASTAAALHREWAVAGAQTLAQQQQICSTLSDTAQKMTAQVQASAGTTLSEVTRLMATTEALLAARMASEADWTTQNGERMGQLASLLRSELAALRDDEAQRGHAAVARLAELQTALTAHLTTLGTALEAPITRLIATASEAPRAAAEVIAQLRQEMSGSLARDNDLLEERSRILATLNSLLEGIHQAAAEQRSVVDALVASSAAALNTTGEAFSKQVGLETAKLSDIAAHVTGSAVEVSSLGETFGFAVNAFTEANEKLVSNLQRIEAAMDKSMARSDDQLAYYVAQAREIIDLSVMSQKEIFEELRQLPARQALLAEEVR